jgi:pantoate--beta-alanine ligase
MLAGAARALATGAPVDATLDDACKALRGAGLAPDYFVLVNAKSLEPINSLSQPARLLTAAKLGPIRLLDNVAV